MSESKASRRGRPVKSPSGEILEVTEPAPGRRWWLLLGAPILVVVLAVTAGLQWRFGWVDALPHAKQSTASSVDLAPQAAAAEVASSAEFAPINQAAVAAALRSFITGAAKKSFGPHLDVLVTGLTGSGAFINNSAAITPASTLKLLTATAALDVLGPEKRFTTSVRQTGARAITIVGGGDPYLATSASATTYPRQATLTDLATQTASYLKAHHLRRVTLAYDSSLFSGPGLNPSWEKTYFTSGVIAPIAALWTNEGRVGDDGALSANPALTAAQAFAGLLRAKGIVVVGSQNSVTTSSASPTIASVTSAPLVDQLDQTLGDSDNFAAEVIARQVAVGSGQPASFTGAVSAIAHALTRLGVPTAGLKMYDGSGLSRHDRLQPQTLAAVLRLATTNPKLSGLLTDLPVAGFSGTLGYRFDKTPAVALGLVRAKTGTLTNVNSMAGVAVDANGVPLIFVAIADRVAQPNTLEARALLDRIGAALTTCRCSQP